MKICIQRVCIWGIVIALCSSSAQGEFKKGIYAQFPCIVNNYSNAGTEQEIDEAIKEANKILKQAGFKLVVKKTNNLPDENNTNDSTGGDNGTGGGTASDGNFTLPERNEARTFGGDELEELSNHRGIKISFANEPNEGDGTKGISVVGNPTVIVRLSGNDEGGSEDTGQTIAHELGHALGLGPNHLVGKGPPEVRADPNGHTTEPNNVMQPTESGKEFTEEQIDQMWDNVFDFGKCSSQWDKAYPAEKLKQQHGASTDSRNDTLLPYYISNIGIVDIDRVTLSSFAEADHTTVHPYNLEITVTVNGIIENPVNDTIMPLAYYILGFDTDNDPNTGITWGTEAGSDQALSWAIMSDTEGNVIVSDFFLETYYYNGEFTFYRDLLGKPDFEISTFTQYENIYPVPDGMDKRPVGTYFDISIPKHILDLNSTLVPITLVSYFRNIDVQSEYFIEADSNKEAIYNLHRGEQDPSLITYGNGAPSIGENYEVTIEGLLAYDDFTLYVDDQPVYTGTLDSTGSADIEFLWPETFSPAEAHFLTAQDSTGEFAYNVSCPASE